MVDFQNVWKATIKTPPERKKKGAISETSIVQYLPPMNQINIREDISGIMEA